jgi:hypothetical protein
MITPDQIAAIRERNDNYIALGHTGSVHTCALITALLDEHALLLEVAEAAEAWRRAVLQHEMHDTYKRFDAALDALRKARESE